MDGIRLKLIRAEQHLNDVWELLKLVRYGDFTVTAEYDSRDGMVHLRAHLPKPDVMVPVVVGDCVHNMRSALDHLVWQMVLIDGNTPNQQNMFPICKTLAGFDDQIGSRQRLRGVSVPAVALIRGLQPYHRGQPGCDLHPLWILSELANIDKHRALAVTTVCATSYHLQFPSGGSITVTGAPGGPSWSAQDGAEFYGFRPQTVPDAATLKEMSVDAKGSFFVAFRDTPAPNPEVFSTLQSILEFIRQDVIPAFEPFFD